MMHGHFKSLDGNRYAQVFATEDFFAAAYPMEAKSMAGDALKEFITEFGVPDDRIPSTTPGADPPRDAKDSGSARSHSMHLETSSSNRP